MSEVSNTPDHLAGVRAGLDEVAGLLAECADRVRALSTRPADEIPAALDALLTDLAAVLAELADGQ